MDAAFSAAVRAAQSATDDHLVAVTMLSVADGVDAALARCTWDLESICVTVKLLGRCPEGCAPTRLVLGSFMANQKWRDRYCDCAARLLACIAGDGEVDDEAVGAALHELETMAMDLTILSSSGVGKACNTLRKCAKSRHAGRAKALVDKWKALAKS